MPIVTNPTAGDVHVNTPLTNFSQKYLMGAQTFIASRAFPNLPVAKQSDLYYEFNRGDFFRDEAKLRADGTESAGTGFRLSTSPYFANVWAFHKDVTDRQRANADSPVQLDISATQFVTHKLLIRRELDFVSSYISSGLWGTDMTGVNSGPTGSQFLRWDQAASDPIADIRTGARTIQGATGYRPNKMIISRKGYDALLDNDAVLARITGGADRNTPAMVMRRLLAELFELDEIFVLDAVYNSEVANQDATQETIAFVGGNDALLYYAPNTIGLNEPTAGAQFSWTGYVGATSNGARIKRFRNELTASDRIEGEMAFDYKLTGAQLGYYFIGVTA